jgi:hypothetical protein
MYLLTVIISFILHSYSKLPVRQAQLMYSYLISYISYIFTGKATFFKHYFSTPSIIRDRIVCFGTRQSYETKCILTAKDLKCQLTELPFFLHSIPLLQLLPCKLCQYILKQRESL